MTEQESYIALNMMEKVGPVSVRQLVSHLGSARAIFEAPPETLREAQGVGKEIAATIVAQRKKVDWKGEVKRASARGIRLVSQVDEDYPKRLLEIHDPPLALYVWGALDAHDKHAMAVVGTRRPTHYGRECSEKLAFQLAKAGFTVVSGMAEGIDTAAHRGALKASGRTLAVIGSGLDNLYPASNEDLAREIAEQGAVISEYPLDRKPDKTTFPIRNRIVSGLSMGILVVEAGRRSGAIITANQALEQGRHVFAVPGRIDSNASRGVHDLIKDGARLVADVDDILEEYEFLLPSESKGLAAARKERIKLSDEETRILTALEDGEKDVDTLIRDTGLKPAAVSAWLIGLEMKRKIRMLPGRIVEAR